MKKTIRKIYQTPIWLSVLLPVLITWMSCNKKLDEKPASTLQVPASVADFQALMDNTTKLSLIWPYAGIDGSDEVFVKSATLSAATITERNAYTWNRNVFNDLALNDWSLPYSVIYYANVTLEGAAKYGGTDTAWANVKGQASFFRGYAYYWLAQEFCKPYTEQGSATDPGIVIRASSDLNTRSVRATVAQTYEQIIADLAASVQLLPLTAVTKTRPCRAAAYAMLARTYLAMARYDKAGLYADSSLRLQNTLLDYNVVLNSGAPLSRFNAEVSFHTTSFPTAMLLAPKLLVDTNLFTLYGAGDLRRDLFFKEQAGSSYFTFNGSYDGTILLFNGLATDEMYLVRAEAEARSGSVSSALKDLNMLRKNRFSPEKYEPLVTADGATALTWVLLERRRELLFRGLRWTDLRRLNLESNRKVMLTKVVGGEVFELPPGDLRYTWPIPQSVIAETGIAQN